ncbi:formyl transferase [Kickxella alabastrina]|uniref:formyl transferase n=1 Tax=Kickxella alabastrina TaxID=61397 RepID=UPI002221244F|nr:formyl transferase [Kickxella alabastrina]KAI7822461.1 formyl transferase [Kickxella alabastrina]
MPLIARQLWQQHNCHFIQQKTRSFTVTSSQRLKVLFFGTDEFGAKILKALAENKRNPNPLITELAVVCPATQYYSKLRANKPRVMFQAHTDILAYRYKLPVMNPPEGKSLTGWAPNGIDGKPLLGFGNEFDIGVVASFGMFLPPRIINMFPKGMINVHPSLLPQYRGPSPIQAALLNGDTRTGVTIQEVHPQVMDGGRVLAQLPYEIDPRDKYIDMAHAIGRLSGSLTIQVLENLDFVRRHAVDQDASLATQTKLYKKADAQIIWEQMTATDIMRMHRAFYQKEPVHTFLRIKNKIHHVQFMELVEPKRDPLSDDFAASDPGTAFFMKKVPYVEIKCIDGSRIHVTRFKVAGKAERDAFQFAAGYHDRRKGMRLLSRAADVKRPTPPFVYPPGYERPAAPGPASDGAAPEPASDGAAPEPASDGAASDVETLVDLASDSEGRGGSNGDGDNSK